MKKQRKQFIFPAVLLCLFSLVSHAQPPAVKWQRVYGATHDEEAYAMQVTTDGGFVLAGSRYIRSAFTGEEFLIIKLDSLGIVMWEKQLGGENHEQAQDIQQTADGGYIVAGSTNTNRSGADVSGNHGGYDMWIVKLDSAGTVVWKKCYGSTRNEYAYAIRQTADGGYIAAGQAEGGEDSGDVTGERKGGYDMWIVKLTETGTVEWQKSLGGPGSDLANDIEQTADGGYIIAGVTGADGGDVTGHRGEDDGWIVKINATGEIEWQRTLGGSDIDKISSVRITNDEGYVLAGFAGSSNGDLTNRRGGLWIIRLDATGEITWQETFGGTQGEVAYAVEQTADGGYIAAGTSSSSDGDLFISYGGNDAWIIKLDENGQLRWNRKMGEEDHDYARVVKQLPDGRYAVAGNLHSPGTGDDMWLILLDVDPVAGIGNIDREDGVLLYPNPSTDLLNVLLSPGHPFRSLQLFNMQGQVVLSRPTEKGLQQYQLGTSAYPPGVYLLLLSDASGRTVSRRFVKE